MDNDYKRRFDNASSQASLRNEAAEIESHPLASRTPVQNDRLRQIDVELQKLIRENGECYREVVPAPSTAPAPSSVPAPSPGLDVNKEADIDTGTLLTHPAGNPTPAPIVPARPVSVAPRPAVEPVRPTTNTPPTQHPASSHTLGDKFKR